jgi:hypothetical protein
MQSSKAEEVIMQSTQNITSIFGRQHYVCFFLSPKDGLVHAYDGPKPMETYKRIIECHPDFEFLMVKAFDTVRMAQDQLKYVREAMDVYRRFLSLSECIEVTTKIKQPINKESK